MKKLWNRLCLRLAYSSLFPSRLKYWIAVHVMNHYTARGKEAYLPKAIDKALSLYWVEKKLSPKKNA